MDFSPSFHPQIQVIVDDLHKTPSFSIPIDVLERFQSFNELIVLGIGGPALCGRVLQSIAHAQGRPTQTVTFRDNLSPLHTADYTHNRLKDTGIIILSKSGETLETLFEAHEFLKLYQGHRLSLHEHFLIGTEHQKKPNHLYRIAKDYAIPTLALSPHIDGRFSLFAATGQILGSLMNIDISAFRRGAKDYLDSMTSHTMTSLGTLFHEQGPLNNHVLWVYDEALIPLVEWWSQLIGESLGKKGEGLTPMIAVGPKDQHSQLQLYLGGPRNKYFTFLSTSPSFEHLSTHLSHKFPHHSQHIAPELDLETLFQIGVKDIIALQMHMVMDTLADENIPHRLFHVKIDDPFDMGKLCMRIMTEVWMAGMERAIDPFGQPDIEKVKQKVLDLLQRV